MGDKTRAHLPALDGLRAFAVLAVVLFHTVTLWFPGGNVGVDLFFVLSGFLITRILVAEMDRTGRISFGGFYLRRALRLLPALLGLLLPLTVADVVLLHGENRRQGLYAVLAAVTYTSSLLVAAGHNLGALTHMWSLSVEEYFYFVWPIALLLITLKARRHRLFIIAGLTTASSVYRLVVGLAGWPIERIYYAADTRSDELLAGCLLALLIARCRLPVRDIYAIPAGALLMAFVVLPTSWTSVFYRDGGSFAIALASAAIVAILVQRPEGSVAHILRFRPLVWIGRRSYGMYLWNLPLAAMVGFVLPGSVLTTLLVLALSVLVPALSYRFVEQPFLILKTRATKARSLPVRTAICSEPASMSEGAASSE